MDEDKSDPDYLKRLDSSYYRGTAFVHWVHTIQHRTTGWLDADFHHRFRETLIHCCFRYRLWCPCYCLMPDHIHLLLLGTGNHSDQRKANRWLRKRINWLLESRSVKLQKQAYDHILRSKERDRFTFENTAAYIRENPVRAELVEKATDWQYQSSVLLEFSEIAHDDNADEFWGKFWKLYYRAVEKEEKGTA